MNVRLIGHVVCGILITSFIGYAFYWIKYSDICLIRNVKVLGYYQHTGQSNIKSVVEPLLFKKNIFNVRLKDIKKSLLHLPWISEVTLARYWPGTLEIFIQEHVPIACWNDVDLMNEKGLVFKPQEAICNDKMPKLYGSDEFASKIFYDYQKINKEIFKLGSKIKIFSMDNRFSVKMVLDNGLLVVVGKIDPINRVNKFVKFYAKIDNNKISNAESVDLRYPNGFAVKHKKTA